MSRTTAPSRSDQLAAALFPNPATIVHAMIDPARGAHVHGTGEGEVDAVDAPAVLVTRRIAEATKDAPDQWSAILHIPREGGRSPVVVAAETATGPLHAILEAYATAGIPLPTAVVRRYDARVSIWVIEWSAEVEEANRLGERLAMRPPIDWCDRPLGVRDLDIEVAGELWIPWPTSENGGANLAVEWCHAAGHGVDIERLRTGAEVAESIRRAAGTTTLGPAWDAAIAVRDELGAELRAHGRPGDEPGEEVRR